MERTVRVLFFASAREAVGRSELDWPVAAEGARVREVVEAISSRFARLAPIVRASRIVRNGEYVTSPATRVLPGDELAIHPPYSGG